MAGRVICRLSKTSSLCRCWQAVMWVRHSSVICIQLSSSSTVRFSVMALLVQRLRTPSSVIRPQFDTLCLQTTLFYGTQSSTTSQASNGVIAPVPDSSYILVASTSSSYTRSCELCWVPLRIKHILLECQDLQDIRRKQLNASSLKELFENVENRSIIAFIKETNFYHRL